MKLEPPGRREEKRERKTLVDGMTAIISCPCHQTFSCDDNADDRRCHRLGSLNERYSREGAGEDHLSVTLAEINFLLLSSPATKKF